MGVTYVGRTTGLNGTSGHSTTTRSHCTTRTKVTNLGRTIGRNNGQRSYGYGRTYCYPPVYSERVVYHHPTPVSHSVVHDDGLGVLIAGVALIAMVGLICAIASSSSYHHDGWSTFRDCGPYADFCNCDTRIFNGIEQYRNCVPA